MIKQPNTPRGRRFRETVEPPVEELITPPADGRHAELVVLGSADSMALAERRSEELEIADDARRERFLVAKALAALTVVAGIAVAHTLFPI